MKRYRVRVIEDADAGNDLLDIYADIATHDSLEKGLYVVDKLEALCNTLAELPLRGHIPKELERVGVRNYREVHKPYRVI